MKQQVRFCTAAGGVRLAYAVHGNGFPLVRVGTWLSHLELEWESPVWRHWLKRPAGAQCPAAVPPAHRAEGRR